MSFVPLPWCTSQSRISTRSAPCSARACAAATATLLKKQNPIARAASAWWPGGRSAETPHGSPSPQQRVDHRHGPAGRAQRRLVGAGDGGRVQVDRAPAARAQLGDEVDVRQPGARARAGRASRAAPPPAPSRTSRGAPSRPRARRSARAAPDGPGCRARALRHGGTIAVTRRYRTRRAGGAQRSRRRRRRRGGPVRGAHRRARGSPRDARLGAAARRDRLVLGAGRARRRARRRRLARAAPGGHRDRRPRARPPLRRRGPVRGGAGALRRPRGARRALRRRPPRQPRARARGRPRDPPRRPRRRQRDRAPDPAPALRRRGRGGAHRGAREPARAGAAHATATGASARSPATTGASSARAP